MEKKENNQQPCQCPICYNNKCTQEDYKGVGDLYTCHDCGTFIISKGFIPCNEEDYDSEDSIKSEQLYCGMQYYMLQRPRKKLMKK